jgi:hypothetical protein
MSRLEYDEHFRQIIRKVALSPGLSEYQIAQALKINHVKVARKIRQYELESKGFLKIRTGKRRAMQSFLTFKGLLYALNMKAVFPKEAATVRLNSDPDVQLISDPVAMPFHELGKAPEWIQELIPHSMIVDLEKIRLQLKPHLEALACRMEEIVSRARKKGDVKMLSMIETKFSERIYTELLKRVNIDYYDKSYAEYVFRTEYQKCLLEFIYEVLKGDAEKIEEMAQCLSDPYSLEILQKALFPFLVKLAPNRKTSEILVWYTKLSAEELKKELRRFKQAIPKLKKEMRKA